MEGANTPETEASATGALAPASLAQHARYRLRNFGAAIASIAAVGAIVGGLTGYWNAWNAVKAALSLDPQSVQKQAVARPNVAPRLSLVVLPFANLNRDPEQDYFADGLTTDLTTDLARIPGAFVIGRGTAFAYKNKPIDPKSLGRDLVVRWAIQGAVQRNGDQVRVNVSLTDLTTGGDVWSDRFDGDRANLVTLQDQITARLARNLSVELINSEARKSAKESSRNPDAQDFVMRGWSLMNEARSRDNYQKASAQFEEALKLEPENADALTGKAACLDAALWYQFTENPAETKKIATDLIGKALSIRPNSAGARIIKGDLIRFGNPAASIPEYDLALQVEPDFPIAYANRGAALAYSGRPREAIDSVQIALRLSPKDPQAAVWHNFLCVSYRQLRDVDRALNSCRTAIDLNPYAWWAFVGLVWSYTAAGKTTEAQDALAALQRIRPGFTVEGFRNNMYVTSTNPQFRETIDEAADSLQKAGAKVR